MIHPIPPGTRDVLPDEMRELRRLNRALIEVFEERGYGEVATPAIEYDEVLARGDRRHRERLPLLRRAAASCWRCARDMTVPIARLVASRYADAEPPLRLCYLASAYRAVRPQRGQMREFVQAGVELIGAPAPEGNAEVIEVLEAALDAAGLDRAVIGLGDADLYRQLLAELGIERRGARGDPRPARHTRPGRPRGRRSPTCRDRRRAGRDLPRALAAARRRRGARAGPRARRRRGRAGDRPDAGDLRRAGRAAAPPTGSRSTSACCATSATTAARSSRSTTRRSATSSAAAAATTA